MRTSLRARLVAITAAVVTFVGSSARADEPAALEYLDEETGATVTVVAEPLVFAYARRDLAANARDYVTLAAAAVNRGGKVRYVLISYSWSTIDPRLRHAPLPAAESFVLQADDRKIRLPLSAPSAHEAGIGMHVHAPPGSDGAPDVYAADLATLRFVAESRQLQLLSDTEGTTLPYELWQDRRAALRAFVRHMNGED